MKPTKVIRLIGARHVGRLSNETMCRTAVGIPAGVREATAREAAHGCWAEAAAAATERRARAPGRRRAALAMIMFGFEAWSLCRCVVERGEEGAVSVFIKVVASFLAS